MPSKIEWTNETWNPLAGCSVVSPGCTNCYAQREAGGRLRSSAKFAGLTQPSKAGPVWTGEMRLWDRALDQPLRWKHPRMIFVNSMSDLFHDSVPDAWIDRIFEIMGACDDQGLGHTFQTLTKRADRQRDYMKSDHAYVAWNRLRLARESWPPRNIWSGISVEDQRRADERIPHLLDTPAAVRWVSAEPLLGPVDLTRLCIVPRKPGGVRAGIHVDALRNKHYESGVPRGLGPIDWVIVGGESGPGARPFDFGWARSIIAQCKAAAVPVFMKQIGSWAGELRTVPGIEGNIWCNRTYKHKGGDPSEWPEDIRVRQYPEARA